MAKSFYALMGIIPSDTLTRYTTSWLLPPYLLAAYRLLISLYAFVTIFTVIGTDSPLSRSQYLSYFTNLTYWGIACYFFISGLHTLAYARTDRSWLQRWPRPLQALHALYYTTITTYPFLVTIVFWAILYKPPFFPVILDAWSNISQHALNSLFALLEILLPSTSPPPPLHLLFLIILLALYLALAYLTHATQGFYTYSFLDPAQGAGKTAGYIIGIAIAICVIYGLVWGLIWVRKRVTERKEGMEGRVRRGRMRVMSVPMEQARARRVEGGKGVDAERVGLAGTAGAAGSDDVEMREVGKWSEEVV